MLFTPRAASGAVHKMKRLENIDQKVPGQNDMFAPVLSGVPGQMTRCPCGFGAYGLQSSSASSISWYASRRGTMCRGWEGNQRSGVEVAMCHRLKWLGLIHVRAQGLSEGDEHPGDTPHGVWRS